MKRNAFAIGVALIAISGCAWICPDRTVRIDPAAAVIVAAERESVPAAEELQANLRAVTGVTVPIVAAEEDGKYPFVVQEKPVRDEKWAWRLDATRAQFRGVAMWAVLDFLERALGVRWPDGDRIVASERKTLAVDCFEAQGSIPINIRNIRIGGVKTEGVLERNAVFQRRMRNGRHDAPEYGHAFTKYWGLYGQEHRDYFAMRKDGLRGPARSKPEELMGNIAVYASKGGDVAMCCTSTGLVEQIVANWREAGMKPYINLCENDVAGQESCHCPACLALDVVPKDVNPQWETHYADRYVHFGNAVLARAQKERPDVRVAYYAYNATQDAPKRERPAEASVIGLVPTTFTDKYVADYVSSWSKAGAKHYFYRPNRHHYFNVQYLPVGSEKHFFEIMKALRAAGTIGFDYDANSKEGFFQWHQDYVLFRGMAYENETFDEIESHYLDAFGAAKGDAQAYFRYWREEVWNRRLEPKLDEITTKGKWFNFARGLMQNLKDYYTLGDFTRSEKFLAAAEKRTLTPAQAKLVADWRVAHEHAKVFYRALTDRSKENTEKLIAFRRAHNIPLYHWNEQYFGDLTGIEGLLGKERK